MPSFIHISNLVFVFEIIVAELIFLFSAPRRKYWIISSVVGLIAIIALALFFPSFYNIYGINRSWDFFIRYTSIFIISVIIMMFIFKINLMTIASFCMAGYGVQHIAYQISFIFLSRTNIFSSLTGDIFSRGNVLELICFIIFSIIIFVTLGLYVRKNEYYKYDDPVFYLFSFFLLFICIGVRRFYALFDESFSVVGSIYAIVCCLLAISMQFNNLRLSHLLKDYRTIQRILEDEKKQYSISRNLVDNINIKYHDLKHRLIDIENGVSEDDINYLKEGISSYERIIKTNNRTLDILFTEKSLACEKYGIKITFLGDGSIVSFMNKIDIYALFGNALENAIEACKKLDNEESKTIGVTLIKKGSLIVLTTKNYFKEKPIIENGLPLTTKKEEIGSHGFGVKSMKLIASKYDGDLNFSIEDNIFTLNIYLQTKE